MGVSAKSFSFPRPGELLISLLVFAIIPSFLFAADGALPANKIDASGSIVTAKAQLGKAVSHTLLDEALRHFRKGECGEALTLAEKASKTDAAIDGTASASRMLMGVCYHRLAMKEQAMSIWREILEREDGDMGADAGLLLASEQIIYGQYDNAAGTLNIIAKKYFPKHVAESAQWFKVAEFLDQIKLRQPKPDTITRELGDLACDEIKHIYADKPAFAANKDGASEQRPNKGQFDDNSKDLSDSQKARKLMELLKANPALKDDFDFSLRLAELSYFASSADQWSQEIENAAAILEYILAGCPAKSVQEVKAACLLARCYKKSGRDSDFCMRGAEFLIESVKYAREKKLADDQLPRMIQLQDDLADLIIETCGNWGPQGDPRPRLALIRLATACPNTSIGAKAVCELESGTNKLLVSLASQTATRSLMALYDASLEKIAAAGNNP